MKIKELKEFVKKNNIPDDAEILIFADHGQDDEIANYITLSRDEVCEGDSSMIWESEEYEEVYDKDALELYDKNGKVTAILLSNC